MYFQWNDKLTFSLLIPVDVDVMNALSSNDAILRHRTWVSVMDFLGTKPLPETISTYLPRCYTAFTSKRYKKRYTWTSSVTCVRRLYFKNDMTMRKNAATPRNASYECIVLGLFTTQKVVITQSYARILSLPGCLFLVYAYKHLDKLKLTHGNNGELSLLPLLL